MPLCEKSPITVSLPLLIVFSAFIAASIQPCGAVWLAVITRDGGCGKSIALRTRPWYDAGDIGLLKHFNVILAIAETDNAKP